MMEMCNKNPEMMQKMMSMCNDNPDMAKNMAMCMGNSEMKKQMMEMCGCDEKTMDERMKKFNIQAETQNGCSCNCC